MFDPNMTVTVEKLVEYAGRFNEEIHQNGIDHDYVRAQIDLIIDAARLPQDDEIKKFVFLRMCEESDKVFRKKRT